MNRKSFKRNIQKQRQQRSVTYMKDCLAEEKKQRRVENIKNSIGGAVVGLLLGIGGFYAADHAIEKRHAVIGVKSNVEQPE